jgi:aryl-alcohol dehydrogenase-like predicted oxidoreductase
LIQFLRHGANAMKLGLGTAQFGIPYGATNAIGQLQPGPARAIIQLALENGIDLFDTAPAYGTAEQLIGAVLSPEAKIVTKTSIARQRSFTRDDVADIGASFRISLNNLQRTGVYGLLVHSPDDVQRPGGNLIIELLLELRDRGIVQKIGVSAYTREQLEYCLRRYPLDLYQVPLSYVDQRLVRSGVLRDLASSGAEIHVRSIFLQGILLAPLQRLPDYFAPWLDKLAQIRSALVAAGAAPGAAALAFVRAKTPASYAIVGATSVPELRQLLQQSSQTAAALPFDDFAIDDEGLIDPSCWPAFRTS